MDKKERRLYEFDRFCLDTSERLLRRDLQEAHLTPKVFETLLLLVENSGRIVGKEELLKAIWPDNFVEESSLSQNISLLRKALGDGIDGRRFIETVPKRGYRFVAPVRVVNQEATADNGLAHGGNRVRSLAALPFKPLGGEGGDEFLGLGMADALILKLGLFDGLTVLTTSSVAQYAGRVYDAREVGRRLGVDAVLDGTIQRAGDRVRVTATLLDLRDGKMLWSGKFDERFTDVFALQDSISEKVSGALKL